MSLWKRYEGYVSSIESPFPKLLKQVLSNCGSCLFRDKFIFDKRRPILLAMTLGSVDMVEMIESY